MKAELTTDQHINGRLITAGTIVDVIGEPPDVPDGVIVVSVPDVLKFFVHVDDLREVPSNG